MPRFTISVDEDMNEFVEAVAENEGSKSKAAETLLEEARAARESPHGSGVDDLLTVISCLEEDIDSLHEEIEALEGDVADAETRNEELRKQLRVANSKDDRMSKLVEYVEEERSAEQKWREAGIITRTKWRLLGMPANTDDR